MIWKRHKALLRYSALCGNQLRMIQMELEDVKKERDALAAHLAPQLAPEAPVEPKPVRKAAKKAVKKPASN